MVADLSNNPTNDAGRLSRRPAGASGMSTSGPGGGKALGRAPPGRTKDQGRKGLPASFPFGPWYFVLCTSWGEPETAFPPGHGEPNARAAQHRPGAEHRARPGPRSRLTLSNARGGGKHLVAVAGPEGRPTAQATRRPAREWVAAAGAGG